MRIVGAAGIPAGAVFDTLELVTDETFRQRNIMPVMEHPEVRGYVLPAWPVRHNGNPPPVGTAPLLGQHTEEVLASWLGKGQDDIVKLRAAKVVG